MADRPDTPSGVPPYDPSDVPVDPRYSLANERTFLAWIRTTLAVLAGAVALDSLEIPEERWLRSSVVVVMLLFGASTTVLAYRRWRQVEDAMRRGAALPSFGLGRWLTAAVSITAIVLVVVLV